MKTTLLGLASLLVACGGTASTGGSSSGGTTSAASTRGGTSGEATSAATTRGGSSGGTTGAASTHGGTSGSTGGSSTDGGLPAGWLYTSGNQIYLSNGSGSGTVWMGRGVNMDDLFFCGYNDTLWMTSPEATIETIVSGVISGWKPNFIRMSLSMDSNATVVSWLSDPSQYATPMTAIINDIGANSGVYVLVTLRSDASMIGQDTVNGDPEATGIPSDASDTPDATTYPTGTDAVYQALVDSFAHDDFVLFGLTNEPGGDTASDSTLSAAMGHAVGVIRAEEDKLGVPHHLVSVQGQGWTSDITFYGTTPLPYDNVVYEIHGYPPSSASYTYSNIPVIVGEYGPSGSDVSFATAFYADVEAKHIPNLAWDFDPYNDCAPDLANVTTSATNLTASNPWGTTVQAYLLAH